jgi:hypothetical protein
VAGRITSIEISSYFGNRTSDLLAFSQLLQTTTLPRVSLLQKFSRRTVSPDFLRVSLKPLSVNIVFCSVGSE